MKIKIVGAGFSGLTLAYYLQKYGAHDVEVIEKSDGSGGLISSHRSQEALLETAANAILNNSALEELCQDLNIEILPHLKSSRNRFVFLGHPRNIKSILKGFWPLLIRFLFRYFLQRAKTFAHPQETVEHWVHRQFSADFLNQLIAPGLQGIYGNQSKDLSASLIFNKFLKKNSLAAPPRKFRGSVSFHHGLGEFLKKLTVFLQQHKVIFHWNNCYTSEHLEQDLKNQTLVVFCTPAYVTSKILQNTNAFLSRELLQVNYTALASISVLSTKTPQGLSNESFQGFGMLFPQNQNFSALGVLFPKFIFTHRGPQWHETWILPLSEKITDAELTEQVLTDRKRVFQEDPQAQLNFQIFRWPNAIPRYDRMLEAFLAGFHQEKKYFLHGNYLGEIGLGQILLQSRRLAQLIHQRSEEQK